MKKESTRPNERVRTRWQDGWSESNKEAMESERRAKRCRSRPGELESLG